MMKITTFIIAMTFCFCGVAKAQKQDTTLKGQTIEVIQSYKPEVKQAPKPTFSAEMPPRATSTPTFQYDVPEQLLSYSYTAVPIRPLALGKDSSELPYPNYVKLGAGNLSTIYLDAGVGGISNDKLKTAIHLHHLQQQGEIKYQRTAFTGAEATGSLVTKNLRYNGGVDILRNAYWLYGGFTDTTREAPKHVYGGVSLSLDAMNLLPNKAGIDYNPSIKIGVYGRKGINERMINIAAPISKKLDEHFTVSAAINLLFANLNITNASSYNNNILQFAPKIAYENEGFNAHLSVKPTLGRGDFSYILPDIYLKYKLPNVLFSLFAGWDGTLQQNTFQQLSSYNPYITTTYTIRQTKQDEIFGGLSTGIGSNFTFSGKLSYRDYKNLPLFVNNTPTDNTFFIVYDDVKAISVDATIRYDIADIFTLKVGGSYYNYYEHTYDRVWHEPALRFNADFVFKPFKDFTFTAYSRVLDGIYTLDGITNETVKLKAAFDVGFGGELIIVPRLTAFLNINNLFDSKYQRWHNYDAYGFNIFGGLRVKF